MRFILTLIIFLTTHHYCLSEEYCCPDGALQNLTVQEAECLALDDNFDVQSFLYLVDKGYYDKLAALGPWMPRVSGNAFTQRQPVFIRNRFRYATFNSSTLSFFQNVINMDEYFNVKAANLNYKLNIANLFQVTSDVLFNVRNLYFLIISLQLNVEVQKENVKLLQQLRDREKARFLAGEGTPYLVNQSEASLENAYTLLYEAEKQLKLAIYDFLSRLGLPPQTCLTLEEKDIIPENIPFIHKLMQYRETGTQNCCVLEKLINSWSSMAYTYNTEIEIRRIEYQLDVNSLKQRIGKYAPKVNLFARFFNLGGKNAPPPLSFWTFGVNAEWEFFDGFARENNVKSASKLVKSAASEFWQAVLLSKTTIADRLAEMVAAIQSYRSSKRAVEVAEEAVQIALLQQEVGDITFLDYLKSVQDLLVARQNFIRAKFDQVSAYFGLLRVAGTDILNLKQGLVHTCGFAYFGDYEAYFDMQPCNGE